MEKGTWLGGTIPTCELSMGTLLRPCPGVPNPHHTTSWGFVSPKQWEGCAGICQAVPWISMRPGMELWGWGFKPEGGWLCPCWH